MLAKFGLLNPIDAFTDLLLMPDLIVNNGLLTLSKNVSSVFKTVRDCPNIYANIWAV
ncbi:hypothetical protein MAH4_30450 [Sessilibacter sp. MAH4]